MLPAGRGDCLWIEYGDPEGPHRILIDGGIHGTSRILRERIEALPEEDRRFDLLVITHIDFDHIAGILPLLRDPPRGLQFDDVWFNAWQHLPGAPRRLSSKQAEVLSTLIEGRRYPWNRSFGGKAVTIGDDGEPLAVPPLSGGMHLTLLGPTRHRLAALRLVWELEIREAGLKPGQAGETLEAAAAKRRKRRLMGELTTDVEALASSRFSPDSSEANGSSIAFLAKYDGKSCLFTGDAFAGDVLGAIHGLAAREGKTEFAVNALKLSHHGGHKNTSRELIDALVCDRFLISTDGTIYEHPDRESVARVIVHGRKLGTPELCFNYRSEDNRLWDDETLAGSTRRGYRRSFAPEGDTGLAVDL